MRLDNVRGLPWFLCLQYFVAEALSISAWRGAYSLTQNYISDLGATNCAESHVTVAGPDMAICSPLHWVMNASFEIQGVLILAGAILIRDLTPKRLSFVAALALVAASSVGLFLVGWFPEDSGSPLHYFGAAENLTCCNLGMAMFGFAIGSEWPARRPVATISVIAGLLGLAGLALLGTHHDLGFGIGAVERLAAYPFPIWLSGAGLLLLTRTDLQTPANRAETTH